MEEERCSSCGSVLFGQGNVIFKCPNCGEGIIGRCIKCRDQSVAYVCKVCGFEGP